MEGAVGGMCDALYQAVRPGNTASLMRAEQAAELHGFPTLVGPYTGAAVFHDEALGLTAKQKEKMGGTDGKGWLFTSEAP